MPRLQSMKIKLSYIIALVISVLIIIWFAIGGKAGLSSNADNTETPPIVQAQKPVGPSVKVDRLQAEYHENFIKLHGRTEAVREVAIKAETRGLVVKTPIAEGRRIKRGTVVCEQDIDARQAMLDQANAVLRSRELEYDAAQKLVDKGFRSPTQALGALAALDGAKASVTQAQIELGNVIMRAPFDGIFEQQMAEIGDYLSPGQPCGLLVDLDPLIVAGEATEKQIGLLSVGKTANITLATGQNLTGIIRYIEARANPATRTFKVEVEVSNKSGELKAGVTASLKISAGQVKAHLIPASVLTLDDNGRIGVRHLDIDNRVRFTVVNTIDEQDAGIWVTGLPDQTELIIRGQDFVSEGITVRTQYDLNASTSEPQQNRPQ